MKKAYKIIKALYPHLLLSFSLIFITLWILQRYNPTMEYLTSELSYYLMLIYFIYSLAGAVAIIIERSLSNKKSEKS